MADREEDWRPVGAQTRLDAPHAINDTSPDSTRRQTPLTVASSLDVGDFEVHVLSVNFHGASLRVSRKSHNHRNNAYGVIFSYGDLREFLLLTEGDHLVSFHAFGFTGFHARTIRIEVVAIAPYEKLIETDCIIRTLPHVGFYRDAHVDHHMSVFFHLFRPDLVSYGNIGPDYCDRGVVLFSADIDQAAIPQQIGKIVGPPLEKLQRGEALLLIDQSHEGNPFSGDFASDLHQALQAMGIREDLVFFLNHTHKYSDLYEAWAAEAGVDHKINVFYANWYADGYFLRQEEFFQSFGGVEAYLEQQRLRAFSDIIRPKRYMSLNYTARPHRVLLVLELLQRKYLNDGYVSFGGTRNADQYKGNFYEMGGEGFVSAMGREELLPHLPDLDAMGAWTLDEMFQSGVEGEAIRMSATSPDTYFQDSYFSVVTESEFMASDFMRVTEKTFKPLLRLHPALIVGNYNTWGLLEDMGYRRPKGFFDESYDKVTDARTRFSMAMAELERVMAQSPEELASRYRDAWPDLEHNVYTGVSYMRSGMKRTTSDILNAMYRKLSEARSN